MMKRIISVCLCICVYAGMGIGCCGKNAQENDINVKSICFGEHHSGAITENGDLYMWGYNEYGELGDGTMENRTEPVKIMENVVDINSSGGHCGAITEDGRLYMWGGHSNIDLRFEPIGIELVE